MVVLAPFHIAVTKTYSTREIIKIGRIIRWVVVIYCSDIAKFIIRKKHKCIFQAKYLLYIADCMFETSEGNIFKM